MGGSITALLKQSRLFMSHVNSETAESVNDIFFIL